MSVLIEPDIIEQDEAQESAVFLEKKLYPESQFYIIGRRVERLSKDQPVCNRPLRRNCNSFYFFIGDNKDLTGLEAIVNIEGEEFRAESPSTVMIPKKYLHSYKLAGEGGWFFDVVLGPSHEESIIREDFDSVQLEEFDISKFYKKFDMRLNRPSGKDRPIGPGGSEIKNPKRYVLVEPNLFEKAGIYAALHQILPDVPFDLNQQLHSNYEDEVYIFFSREGQALHIDMFESEHNRVRVTSPKMVYHPKGALHRYDYVNGQGFMLVVLKESIPGDGYRFIPSKG